LNAASEREKDAALPFSVNRSEGRDLTSQMADGLRRAIVGGYYKAGQALPTLEEFSSGLGVSMNVARAAMRKLAQEGLILPRRHVGSVVQQLGAKKRRGHVLIVQDDTASSHTNVLVGEARATLSRLGYLVSTVVVFKDADGRYDMQPLEVELRNTVNLSILVKNRPAIERVLVRSGIPFMAYGGRRCRSANFVGQVCIKIIPLEEYIVRECVAHGISRVLIVRAWAYCDPLQTLFAKAHIAAEEWPIDCAAVDHSDETVQRSGLEAFANRFRLEGRSWLPELLIFPDDDFLASGCLMALLAEGVKVPGDVRVVTLANKGIGPVFVKPLTRFEIDPGLFGVQIAQYACNYLNGQGVPEDAAVSPVYVPGDTFP
jgi:DNA-binding transcriptional regulator YhcF (GntR family)